MRLKVLNKARTVKVALPHQGQMLEYSDADEIRHLIGLCFPDEETQSLLVSLGAGTEKPNRAVASCNRYSVAAKIESLLAESTLTYYGSYETSMYSADGGAELLAICMSWHESHKGTVSILVSDVYTQLVSRNIPPCTSIDNDNPQFETLLAKYLADYF